MIALRTHARMAEHALTVWQVILALVQQAGLERTATKQPLTNSHVKTIILARLIPSTPMAIVSMSSFQPTAATLTLTATTMTSALTTLASIMHASGLPPPAPKIRIATRAQAHV